MMKKTKSILLLVFENYLLMKKKIKLGITGCMGRMGQKLIKSAKKNKDIKLKAVTENRIIQ